MLIKIVIALLAIAGLALGGEMALTSAVVDELQKPATVDQSGAAVTPSHAAGIPCTEFKKSRRGGWRKACIA